MIKYCLTISLFFYSLAFSHHKQYLGFRHIHNGSAHKALHYLGKKIKPLINKGRVNVYEVIDAKFKYNKLPDYVKEQFFPLKLNNLKVRVKSKKNKNHKKVKKINDQLNKLKLEKYKEYIKSLVAIGSRDQKGTAGTYLTSELTKIGLPPIRSQYNIISLMEGTSDESIVIVGHMDTVRNTVGADDNASGASGVLELARVLKEIYQDQKPLYNIYFVLSEDEEEGLLGAKKFVQDFQENHDILKIKFAINMDMIAYNKNGIIDLETSRDFESLANKFAENVVTYTSQTPNLVLEPWGSDHMPFINKGIPALLTIESWQTHTPCWHKACDTIDTLDFDYAMDILKLNLSIILDFNDGYVLKTQSL